MCDPDFCPKIVTPDFVESAKPGVELVIGPVELGPRTQGHHMEDMTEFEADAIGAAMLLLSGALDVIA